MSCWSGRCDAGTKQAGGVWGHHALGAALPAGCPWADGVVGMVECGNFRRGSQHTQVANVSSLDYWRVSAASCHLCGAWRDHKHAGCSTWHLSTAICDRTVKSRLQGNAHPTEQASPDCRAMHTLQSQQIMRCWHRLHAQFTCMLNVAGACHHDTRM